MAVSGIGRFGNNKQVSKALYTAHNIVNNSKRTPVKTSSNT